MEYVPTYELLLEYFKDAKVRFDDFLFATTMYHFSREDLMAFEKNKLFSEITKKGYDVAEYRDFICSLLMDIADDIKIEDFYKTKLFNLLREMFGLMDMPDNLYTIKAVCVIMDKISLDYQTTADYHKKLILSTATALCLSKKTISFNTAVKTVCQKESEGYPAYQQVLEYNNSSTDYIIEELKQFKEFLVKNDQSIYMDILAMAIFSALNDKDLFDMFNKSNDDDSDDFDDLDDFDGFDDFDDPDDPDDSDE